TMPPLTFMLFQAGLAVLLTLGQLLLTSPGMAQGHQDLPQLDPGRLRVVRGAPFCADAVHGMQQLLADGNRINMQSRSRTCRDSDGRLRQEFERGNKTMVFLRDPTAREFWVMEPDRRRARRLDRQGPAALPLDPDQREAAKALMLQRMEARGPGQRSDLGQRVVEGLQVQGELTTWTIEAGRVGNDKPMLITREVWQSPELMIPVSIQDRDPRFGERFLRVFNIQRDEPEPELMRVPADFLKLEMEQRRPRLLGP
ncbi:MAG: hypothetical protein EB116_15405, partial [Betaproteobacteria bacterium]|nr:hypothetical protein [Betaproteobacteria bacterium]